MKTIQCKGCGEIKDANEFYFANGGLENNGIAEIANCARIASNITTIITENA